MVAKAANNLFLSLTLTFTLCRRLCSCCVLHHITQLLNAYELSTSADVYSFGIIMYEVLTFKIPFEECAKAMVRVGCHRGRIPLRQRFMLSLQAAAVSELCVLIVCQGTPVLTAYAYLLLLLHRTLAAPCLLVTHAHTGCHPGSGQGDAAADTQL